MNGPIQKIDLLTSAWGFHVVPTSKRVKLMVKIWFPVLIYQKLKASMEAMNVPLFEVTTTR